MKYYRIIIPVLCAVLLLSLCSCVVVGVDDTGEAGTKAALQTSEKQTSSPGIDTIPDWTDAASTEPPATEPLATEPPATQPQTEPPTTEPPETEPPKIEFKADLSEYEKYFDPEDPTEYLILVNPDHTIDKSYKPKDLTKVSFIKEGGSSRYMREYAAKAFDAMMIEAKADGCKGLIATSTFRSYSDQESLFQYYVKRFMERQHMTEEEAIAATRVDTAYPGESEHQTGLAVDVHNMSSCSQEFADKYEGKWLAENCWKFGFILRYPLGKEDITSYVFEPWHFRYVGRTHAKRIYDLSVTLEEYLESYYTE